MANNPSIKLTATGGLDLDTEYSRIDNSDYPLAFNMRNSISYASQQYVPCNMNGNVLIAYTLGNATYECIGSLEDKQGTVFYFLWSSDGLCKILRYYPNLTNNNPLGEIQLVYQYAFGWSNDERITGIDFVNEQLLYWVDSVKPRKIDVIKGNCVNKFKTWDFTMPVNASGAYGFQVEAVNLITGQVTTENINLNGATREILLEQLAVAINTHGLQNIFNAEACGCSVTITEKVVNTYNFTSSLFQVIPQNWYGLNIIDRFSDACKYPSQYPPIPTYIIDSTRNYNFVKNHVFQFRIEYIFDNFEQSVLGPISNIAVNNLNCDGTNNVLYNAIDINFNDPLLTDPNTWVLVKTVNIMVRELNTGKWLQINQLNYCDFIEQNGLNLECHCVFYNNELTQAVSEVLSNQNFDNLPIKANAQKFASNKIAYGGITENYTLPDCVEGTYQVKFSDDPQKKGFNVTGIVSIFQPFMTPDGSNLPETTIPVPDTRRSAIIFDSGISDKFPMFGGSTTVNAANVYTFDTTRAYSDKGQILPQAGFTVYLAGTSLFAITKQQGVANVAQRQDGSIDVTGGPTGPNGLDLITFYHTHEALSSGFTIPNVPPGTYVIRIASHWCSFGDLLGKGPMYDLNGTGYQNTSTFVWGVNNAITGQYSYDFEITFTVTNADVNVGEFIISDLTADASSFYEGQTGDAPSISGYLFDNFGLTDVVDVSKGETIEKAFVKSNVTFGTNPPGMYLSKFTDHNGFYFIYALPGGASYSNEVIATQVGGTIKTGNIYYFAYVTGQSALYLLEQQIITQNPGNPIFNHLEEICPCDNTALRGNSSTFITGFVEDQNGHPLPSTIVVYQHGRAEMSDVNGAYAILAWGDMTQGNNNNRVIDELIFIANLLCFVTYPNGQTVGPLDVDPFGAGGYTPTNPFIVPLFLITELGGGAVVALKRGGKFIIGVEYIDWAGRETAVGKAFEIYIPSETEDLSLFPQCVQANGTPYPAGSYVGGIPTVTWFITSIPPQFAYYMQILRTLNNNQAAYFQWAINQVIYYSKTAYASGNISEPAVQTTYANRDAVAIELSLANIIQYNQLNPTSNIAAYQFKQGDRVRLIADQNSNLIHGLYDFEITGPSATGTGIIIKAQQLPFAITAGFKIEIYTPNSSVTASQDIFYETGNVIPCTAPGQPNNALSVTAGTFTDGDTWWGGLLVPVDDPSTNFIALYPLSVESMSISPFYSSLAQDIGRTNIIDPFLVQEYKYTALRVSNTFIPDSQINGLSAFQDVDDVQLDLSFGAIMGLVTTGFVLGAVCQNKFVSNYLGATVGAKTDGSLEIASQQGFIGDSRPLLGDFGTQHPATIVEKDGHVWFADFERGIVGEYSDNGIEEIQKFKVRNFFRQFMISGVWDALAAYDAFYGEYILTAWVNRQDSGIVTGIGDRAGLPPCYLLNVANPQTYTVGQPVIVNVVDSTTGQQISVEGTIRYIDVSSLWIQLPGTYNFIVDSTRWGIISKGQGYTIAFQKDKRRWTTFYSFQPEQMQGVGMNFVTWESGTLWLHDRGPINTFYGTYFPWLLNLVATEPQQRDQPIKTWVAFRMSQLEGNTDTLFSWNIPNITNELGQVSRLIKAIFQRLEQFWHTEMKKDITTTTVANPIVNGREMRSQTLSLNMVNDSTNRVELREVDVIFQPSPGNTK